MPTTCCHADMLGLNCGPGGFDKGSHKSPKTTTEAGHGAGTGFTPCTTLLDCAPTLLHGTIQGTVPVPQNGRVDNEWRGQQKGVLTVHQPT